MQSSKLLKVFEALSSLSWLPVFLIWERTPGLKEHNALLFSIVIALIVISAYVRLTNRRIDALLQGR
jgi:ABC-type nitrate/sulfonate/bicarbonate transport system permease component